MRAGLQRDAIQSNDPDRSDGEGRAGAGRRGSTAIRRSFGSKCNERSHVYLASAYDDFCVVDPPPEQPPHAGGDPKLALASCCG